MEISMEIWDGSPRRKTDIAMVALTEKVNSIYAFLQREFGNTKDDGFGAVEGETKKQLRELNDKVSKQNGRVKKLEDWRFYILGGIAMFMFLSGIIVALSAMHK